MGDRRSLVLPAEMACKNDTEAISALFCDYIQCRVVGCYRPFGSTYRTHLQGSRSLNKTVTMVLRLNFGNKLPFCARQIAEFLCAAAEV